MSVVDKHVPVVKRRVRGKFLPWLSSKIRNLTKQRNYHHGKAIKANTEIHWNTYKRLGNEVMSKLRKKRIDYYSNKFSGKQETKEMWKSLKEILRNRK